MVVYIVACIMIGIALGALSVYFYLKSTLLPRARFDELNMCYIRSTAESENAQKLAKELQQQLENERAETKRKADLLSDARDECVKTSERNLLLNEALTEEKHRISLLENNLRDLAEEKQVILTDKIRLQAEFAKLQELLTTQKEEINQMQQTAKLEFRNLANKILEEKSDKFTALNQSKLNALLKPLGENIDSFRKRVNEVYENEARERFALNSTIKLMMEQSNRISEEANNLAAALKGQTKLQGDWGEIILERILEDSGLTKGREYYSQYSMKNDNGQQLRPDFVLRLPGNQLVIIDSKVSLNAYERMCSSENDDDRKRNLDHHIIAVKRHVDTLATKRYDNLSDALDFTIMFVPVEPAFLTAVQYGENLWNYAYEKHVIILSPTNLIAYLKLISDVWKRADQNRNALEIAERGGKLYDKFVGFLENMEKVGRSLESAQAGYDAAYKQLGAGNDNLIRQTEKLRSLGAKAKKNIPQQMLEQSDELIESAGYHDD